MEESRAIVIQYNGNEPNPTHLDSILRYLATEGVVLEESRVSVYNANDITDCLVHSAPRVGVMYSKGNILMQREAAEKETTPERDACVYLDRMFGKGRWNAASVTAKYLADFYRNEYDHAMLNAIEIVANNSKECLDLRILSAYNINVVTKVYEIVPTDM